MRATLMYGAGDVRVEDVPDAHLIEPGDALVRVTRAAVCGSDLWPYKSMESSETGRRMGHEFIGIVEEVGKAVATIKKGDLVVSPFLWSDGTCVFCQRGLHSSCLHGGRYGWATSMAARERRCVSTGRRHPRCVARRGGRCVDAVAAGADRCDGNRPSRRCWRSSRCREDSGSGRGWGCRTVRRDRVQAARRGSDPPPRPAT